MDLYLLSENDAAELRRILAKVDGFRGEGVRNIPGGITLRGRRAVEEVTDSEKSGGGNMAIGLYPGQVLMTVSNNSTAWEYPRAVTGA